MRRLRACRVEPSPKGVEIERIALDALIDLARAAGDRGPASLVYTSGIWVLGPAPSRPTSRRRCILPTSWLATRARATGARRRDVATARGRDPPGIVYGGSRGIVSDLLASAGNGLMRIVGSGENHWPLVYDRDLADLYVRVMTSEDGRGVFDATDEADEQVRTIADAIAAHRPHPPDIRFVPIAEARSKMGPYADALALDQRVRSPRAHALGWTPLLRSVSGNIPRLFEELRRGRARQQQEHQDS